MSKNDAVFASVPRPASAQGLALRRPASKEHAVHALACRPADGGLFCLGVRTVKCVRKKVTHFRLRP